MNINAAHIDVSRADPRLIQHFIPNGGLRVLLMSGLLGAEVTHLRFTPWGGADDGLKFLIVPLISGLAMERPYDPSLEERLEQCFVRCMKRSHGVEWSPAATKTQAWECVVPRAAKSLESGPSRNRRNIFTRWKEFFGWRHQRADVLTHARVPLHGGRGLILLATVPALDHHHGNHPWQCPNTGSLLGHCHG